MNRTPHSARRRRLSVRRRTKLLDAFDRSGLSAAAFARKHQINYTTFCGWRQRQGKAACSPSFVQIELPGPVSAAELVIEIGSEIRLRISSASQLDVAAALVAKLRKEIAC